MNGAFRSKLMRARTVGIRKINQAIRLYNCQSDHHQSKFYHRYVDSQVEGLLSVLSWFGIEY